MKFAQSPIRRICQLLAIGWMAIVFCGSLIAKERPNILWITCEDTGTQLGCYRDSYATTPNLDSFAAQSLLFKNCWSNAPVCAPARTTLITGHYATSLGAQHMRSSVPLPAGVRTLPEQLRAAGYYCSNNNKEDYNFPTPKGTWDDSSNKAHWKNRNPGQNFFSVFNINNTHEGQIRKRPYKPIHNPSLAPVPPYHPDTEEVRLDWAQYYDRITEMDAIFGRHMEELRKAKLDDSTIVFFFGDHGCGLPRGKRWLYEAGLHVPMIVHIPERFRSKYDTVYRPGTQTTRLVSFIDLLPTVLDLTETDLAAKTPGRSFFAPETESHSFLFGFRDRMDERIDSARAVRDERFMYIRNFIPDKPQGAFLDYMFQTPTTKEWKSLFTQDLLTATQRAFWLPKPVEELYDLSKDPYQVDNIADQSEMVEIKDKLANALRMHMLETKDTGVFPEGWKIDSSTDWQESLDAAWNSGSAIADEKRMRSLVAHPNASVRFWGAIAFRSANTEGVTKEILDMVAPLQKDSSDEVRIVANEGFAKHALDLQARTAAIDAIVKIVCADSTLWFARLRGLNAICDLEATPKQYEQIASNHQQHHKEWVTKMPERYRGYLDRLIGRMETNAAKNPPE